MNILFHRPTPWSSNINCSTKIYSRLFSEMGYNVTYLQSNINLLHFFLRIGYYKVWKKGNRFVDNIWVCSSISIVPYIDSISFLSKFFIKLSYIFCIPSLRNIILKSGYGEPDIIWTTIPGSIYLKLLFPKAKFIFHCIDNYSAYRGKIIENIEKNDYVKSDHIFVIGNSLSDYLINQYGISKFKITNLGQGVNLNNYLPNFSKPNDLKSFHGPIAIWVGLLSKIDVFYFKIVANELAKKNGVIVIIGPNIKINELSDIQNIVFLGPKSTVDVPKYLKFADIGLMLYNRKNINIYKGQHPLKLYEYCAAGLQVISTPHSEFEFINPPIKIIHNEIDLQKVTFELLSTKLTKNNDAIRFASENTWSKCVDKAEAVLKNL